MSAYSNYWKSHFDWFSMNAITRCHANGRCTLEWLPDPAVLLCQGLPLWLHYQQGADSLQT